MIRADSRRGADYSATCNRDWQSLSTYAPAFIFILRLGTVRVRGSAPAVIMNTNPESGLVAILVDLSA